MPGADDTLNAGGPALDPLDELCTCGHTRGEHHTLDEDCTVEHCACVTFHSHGHEFGEGQPSDAQLQAQTDALDAMLNEAQLCGESSCNHRRDVHVSKLDGDGCNSPGCECPAFLEPKSTGGEHEFGDALEVARIKSREPVSEKDRRAMFEQEFPAEFEDSRPLDIEAIRRAHRPRANNTREAADVVSNDARAAAMDAEPMSPVEGMTDEERTESDAVQAETLDNMCHCGHRYGDHASGYGELCLLADCECVQFVALLKPTRAEFERTRADKPPRINPFKITSCAQCGHEGDEHAANGTVCHVEGCTCQAFVEYTSPGLDPKNLTFAHDENIGPHPDDLDPGGPYRERGESAIDHEKLERGRRLPYTPPLLRKRLIGEDELRKLLADAGRLDLLGKLPEVDRVTTNYDAEHWSEIERLARFPQGSSETTVSRERTTKAIATALLELRQCLGVTDYTEQLVKHIERNAAVIHETAVLLDRITSRLPQTGEDT